MVAPKNRDALGTYLVLLARGYRLEVLTRIEETPHPVGVLRTVYGDRLKVSGWPRPIPEDVREAIRENKPLLLAAAAAAEPPTPWVAALMTRYAEGQIDLRTVAANLASFARLDPARDAARIGALARAALKERKLSPSTGPLPGPEPNGSGAHSGPRRPA